MKARGLHFVFKIADRAANAKFFRDILGMKVLRHEEFNEGCLAACNGPYNNRWSKTMIGYGSENDHFVMELTWNTEVKSYQRGNDFLGVYIASTETIARARAHSWPIKEETEYYILESPDGYPFYIKDISEKDSADPVIKVSLASSDIKKTLAFWNNILGLKVLYSDDTRALLTFGDEQASVEFKKINGPIDRGTAYGRIAFATPKQNLRGIEAKVLDNKYTVLTPLITLDTPGKATVTVVILADPDGHEICFVEDEGFTILSEFDPEGNSSMDFQIKKYEKHLAKEEEKKTTN